MEVAGYCELEVAQAREIAIQARKIVAKWRERAAPHGLSKAEMERVSSALEHDDLRPASGSQGPRCLWGGIARSAGAGGCTCWQMQRFAGAIICQLSLAAVRSLDHRNSLVSLPQIDRQRQRRSPWRPRDSARLSRRKRWEQGSLAASLLGNSIARGSRCSIALDA
jgi:hypothetical protein